MTRHTHQTAPTQFVEAGGIRFAYRRFGNPGGVPLVMNIHFTGTMDHWDPAVTDGLAQSREVILFNNAGISSSSGTVPESIEEMAANAGAFIAALGLNRVDVLGFSMGGLIAQELAIAKPRLVRRLILVGTGPRSGEGMAGLTPEAQEIFSASYAIPTTCGCACTSRLRKRARRRDVALSNGSAGAAKTAILKPTTRSRPRNSPRSRSGACRARTPTTTWKR